MAGSAGIQHKRDPQYRFALVLPYVFHTRAHTGPPGPTPRKRDILEMYVWPAGPLGGWASKVYPRWCIISSMYSEGFPSVLFPCPVHSQIVPSVSRPALSVPPGWGKGRTGRVEKRGTVWD